MARALTSEELTLLRSDMQFSRLYLAVYKPNTIYTALLNGVPSSNDQVYQITYDNGSGTLGDVKAGMTLLVGTSAGGSELGICRIRKAPIAGTFYIGLTSEIEWQDNAYLTVIDDFDLWAKHATITDEVLSMDVDVAYSDQHTNFNPVPVLGPHAVVWLDDPTVDVVFDASNSWVHGSTISGYSWSAPGASASSGMTSATPTITYNAAGCYRVFCTVTAANGKSTTGVRHVFVYDRNQNQPSMVFQLAQCYADYDAGGWMFDMEMQAEAGLSDIRDRALVVLFAEDWYGTTKQSIGPVANRENIVCVGRVVGESIRWDREAGRVHFTVQGPHYWLGKIKAFPVEMYFATNTPDSWSVMPAMTVDRALWHILYWHSTAIETMDFYRTGDTRYLPEGKTLASNIWGQLQDIAVSRLLATCGVDRLGRLFVQIDPQMVPEADRTWATVMTLNSQDWSEGIDLQRVIVQDVSIITLSSQMCNSSGAVSVLYSLSPGHVPRRFGEPMQFDRWLASSQSQSNQLAGLALGWHTNPYPEIPVSLAHNNRMIDLWPRQFYALEMTEADTPRGIAFDGNLIPRRITLYFDADAGWLHPEINFEAETFEMPNTDGDVPDVDDMSIPPFPTINFPDLPSFPPLFPGDTTSTPNGPPVVLLLDANLGILRTENFNTSSPTWQFWNTGIASNDIKFIRSNVNPLFSSDQTPFFVTPNGAVYLSVGGVHWEGHNDWTLRYKIYRAASIGARWIPVVDVAWLDANAGLHDRIIGLGYNPNKAEELAMFTAYGGRKMWIGNGVDGFELTATLGGGYSQCGNITFGNEMWLVDRLEAAAERIYRFDASGTYIDSTSSFGQGSLTWHKRAGTSPIILKGKPPTTGAGDLFRSEDNFATWVAIDLVSNPVNIAVSPDGNYMFGALGTPERGRSSDGGYTWDSSFFTFGGRYCYAYCGGAGTASRWILGRGYVRYSGDFGTSWDAREGNLPYLIPTNMTIIKIVVPGYI